MSKVDSEAILAIKTKAEELYALISPSVSREASLAKTALEESVMWAVKHVVNNPTPDAAPAVATDSTGSSDTATPAEPTAA